MRILLLGNTGQLGWELERCLAPLGELTACDYPSIDLADPHSFLHAFHDCQPDLLVNAAAYTAVDRAEAESGLAYAINAVSPGIMAEEAHQHRTAFIHFSTDYVFDGRKSSPYFETDLPAPLSTYGRSKLAGEQAIQQAAGAFIIMRTSWVYSLRRESFVSKVLGWARQRETMKLVTDQVSGPTWARMLAEATSMLVCQAGEDLQGWFTEYRGLYHLGGSGSCSRFEWGQEILQLDPHKDQQVVRQLLPALSEEFPTPAERPHFSALNCDLFSSKFHIHLPDWHSTLMLAMESA